MRLAEIINDFKKKNIKIDLSIWRSDGSEDNTCKSCENGSWELDHSETVSGTKEKVDYYTCKNTRGCDHFSTATVRYTP